MVKNCSETEEYCDCNFNDKYNEYADCRSSCVTCTTCTTCIYCKLQIKKSFVECHYNESHSRFQYEIQNGISKIERIEVFKKCHPYNCKYCDYVVDLCSWSACHCPKCGQGLTVKFLNSENDV